MMAVSIDTICERWCGLDRPLFKGELIDSDGCCCAQGDVLRVSGVSDDDLRAMTRDLADAEVARLLGISRAHSCLLRVVNDRQDGCPQDVLLHHEKVLGDQAQRVLAFWRRLDLMTVGQWAAAREVALVSALDAAREAAWDAAWGAAGVSALVSAWSAAWDAAWDAARDAAGDAVAWAAAAASNEIQGAAIMRKQNQPFYFLPLFGINDPSELDDE